MSGRGNFENIFVVTLDVHVQGKFSVIKDC